MSMVGRNLIFIILPIALLFAYFLFNGADNRIQAQNNNSCTLWEKNDSTATFSGQIEYFSEKDNTAILLDMAAELKISFQYGSGGESSISYDTTKKEFIFPELKFNTNKAVAKLTINAPGFINYEEELLFSDKENKIRKTGSYWGKDPAIRLEKSPYKLTAYSGRYDSVSNADFSNDAGYKVTIFDESKSKITEGVTQRVNYGPPGPPDFYTNEVVLYSDKFVSGRSYFAQYEKNNQVISVIRLFPTSSNSPMWLVDLFSSDKKIIGSPYIIFGKVLVANTNFHLPGTEVYIEQNGKTIPISNNNSFFGDGAYNSESRGLSGSTYQIDNGLAKGSAKLVAKYANQFEFEQSINISSAITKQDISINIPIICNKTAIKDIDVATPGVDVKLTQNNVNNAITTNLDGGFRNFMAIDPEYVYGYYLGYNFSAWYSFYSIDARKLGLSCDYQTYNTNSTCNFKNALKPETKLLNFGEVKYQLTPNVNNVSSYDILDKVEGYFYLGDRTSSGSRTYKLNKRKPQDTANNVSSDKIEIPLSKYNTLYGRILPPEGRGEFKYGADKYRIEVVGLKSDGTIESLPLGLGKVIYDDETDEEGIFMVAANFAPNKKYQVTAMLGSQYSADNVPASNPLEIKFDKERGQRLDITIVLNEESELKPMGSLVSLYLENHPSNVQGGVPPCKYILPDSNEAVDMFRRIRMVKYKLGRGIYASPGEEKYNDKVYEAVVRQGREHAFGMGPVFDIDVEAILSNHAASVKRTNLIYVAVKLFDENGQDLTNLFSPTVDNWSEGHLIMGILSRKSGHPTVLFLKANPKNDYHTCQSCKYHENIQGYICNKDGHLPSQKEDVFASAVREVANAYDKVFLKKPRPKVLGFFSENSFVGAFYYSKPVKGVPTLSDDEFLGTLPYAEEYIFGNTQMLETRSLESVMIAGYHEAAHMKMASHDLHGYWDKYEKKVAAFMKIFNSFPNELNSLFLKKYLEADDYDKLSNYLNKNIDEYYAVYFSTAFTHEPEIRRDILEKFLVRPNTYSDAFSFKMYNKFLDLLLRKEI